MVWQLIKSQLSETDALICATLCGRTLRANSEPLGADLCPSLLAGLSLFVSRCLSLSVRVCVSSSFVCVCLSVCVCLCLSVFLCGFWRGALLFREFFSRWVWFFQPPGKQASTHARKQGSKYKRARKQASKQ